MTIDRIPIESVKDRCPRCRSFSCVITPIHHGKSYRMDCKDCNRFLQFLFWYGKSREVDLLPIVNELKQLSSEREKMDRIERYVAESVPNAPRIASELIVDRRAGKAHRSLTHV